MIARLSAAALFACAVLSSPTLADEPKAPRVESSSGRLQDRMLGVSGYGELDRDNPPLRTAQPLVPLAEWFDADSVLVRAHVANAKESKYARLVLKISPDGRVAECRHKRDQRLQLPGLALAFQD